MHRCACVCAVIEHSARSAMQIVVLLLSSAPLLKSIISCHSASGLLRSYIVQVTKDSCTVIM